MRSQLGVELGAEPLRDWVRSLGLVAPVVYVGLVTFRQFLLVPSTLLLAAGGLAFGAALGTLLGGVGIVLSALLGFTLARTLGREWLRLRMGDRLGALERHSQRVGPLVVGLATAHPLGPMSPFHWGAGLASMSWLAFFAVVLVAGPARAFLLSTSRRVARRAALARLLAGDRGGGRDRWCFRSPTRPCGAVCSAARPRPRAQ